MLRCLSKQLPEGRLTSGTSHLHPFCVRQLPRLSKPFYRHHGSTTGLSTGLYQTLNSAKNEIRVLKIESGRWEDDIKCSLKVTSLDGIARTRYDTLSYTWGDPETTRRIMVDQQNIDVSVNLFTAVRALRRRFGTATIWADALCINQQDDREKSTQVALMGRVYKQGRQTWVSLGCPDEKWANGSWVPAHHIRERAHILQRAIRGVWRLVWHHFILRRSRQSRLGVNHISDAVRIANHPQSESDLSDEDRAHRKLAITLLTWLTGHDYWSRVWIVQEIALSQIDPICVFGRHQIPLLSLDTVLGDWLGGDMFSQRAPQEAAQMETLGTGADRTLEICLLRDEYISRLRLRIEGSMDMLRALQLASFRRASVVHDHVYGLRSLLPIDQQKLLQPDYSLSTQEVYASTTRTLLQREESGRLLCAAVGISPHNKHNLPSWSLDFSQPLRLPVRGDDTKGIEGLDQVSRSANVLRIQGRSRAERVTFRIPMNAFNDPGHYPTVSKFLRSDIYEEDTQRLRGAGPATNHQMDSPNDMQYIFFLTDLERVGKCSNEVLPGDELWTFVGADSPFVLRPVQDDGLGYKSRERYRLVGPSKFFDGAVESTPHADAVLRVIELI
jgi:hypothetical protein